MTKRLTGREEIVHVERREAKATEGEMAESASIEKAAGLRVDKILAESARAYELGIKAMEGACRLHQQMADALLSAEKARGEQQKDLLQTVQEHFIARVQAEVDAIAAEDDASPEGGSGDDVMGQLAEGFAQGVVARIDPKARKAAK